MQILIIQHLQFKTVSDPDCCVTLIAYLECGYIVVAIACETKIHYSSARNIKGERQICYVKT